MGLLSTAKDGGLYFKFINSKKYEIRLAEMLLLNSTN